MEESESAVQTTSREDLAEVTSSDQTENNHEEETKTFSTFGFDVKTQKTDLVLIFGKYRLYARRVFLEEASPVLERLFDEKLTGKTDQEVAIEDVSCEDFAEFLACTLCIQRKRRRKITKENVYRMLEIANKYEVEDLKERCEECLLDLLDEEKLNLMSVLRLLHLANENNLPSLESRCIKGADWKILDTLQDHDKDVNLSLNSRMELMEKFLPKLLSKSYIIDFLKTASCKEKTTKLWEFDNARGHKVRFNVSQQTKEESFNLFGIEWKAEIGECSRAIGSWYISLTSVNKLFSKISSPTVVKIGLACKILNYMPKREDCSAFKTFTYQESNDSNGISWNSVSDMNLSESDLWSEDRGFSYDGKFDIEVYILMNKPESVSS